MRWQAATGRPHWGTTVDAKGARRLAMVRHEDWPFVACQLELGGDVFINKVGTFGVAATFSFYPGKNLGAMGDAGAVVTNDADVARRIAMFARHGGLRKGDHEIEGINSRMDGLQAAILNVKLPHLSDWTVRRQDVAEIYTRGLSGLTWLDLPAIADGVSHVWHLYVVGCDRRNDLAAYLKEAGIQTSVNYPRALHQLPCYSHLGHAPEDFPEAQKLAERGLAIPMFAEIIDTQIVAVIEGMRRFGSQ